MKLFTIGDLHLSIGVDKPMDIFGSNWTNYMQKIENNWQQIVGSQDVVVICGDVSWAINFEELTADFAFLNRLNGKKYILKGNHDYWWGTLQKMNKYLEENAFDTISFLHNNSYDFGDYALCGTRGWFMDEDISNGQNQRIFQRELIRLEASLKHASQRGKEEKIAFLHYPPIYGNYRCDPIIDILKQYEVGKCFFGHLHGSAHQIAFEGILKGIRFKLVSADFLNFVPFLVANC